MKIKQWEDKNLAQFSYGIISDTEKKAVLIDPSRNPQPYLDWAKDNDVKISAIIETHPHADFVSSHLELHQKTGAAIYTHGDVAASYPHEPFNEGKTLSLGELKFRPLHTPGHSPDSISIVLEKDGKQHAVFTGDTLFIGDCGRPDLREGAGNSRGKREDLARQMYHSLRNKLMKLEDDVVVYPAHGAGTLCGKNLGKENSSTVGKEKKTNWCLQEATEGEFVKNLLADQPFVPMYFPFDVELNRKGAAPLHESIEPIEISEYGDDAKKDDSLWIVDVRKEDLFKKGHIPGSINLMLDGKFETWLGSIIRPGEKFYLAGDDSGQLKKAIARAASIGYETGIMKAWVVKDAGDKDKPLDFEKFRKNTSDYTIVDVRNQSEVAEGKIFEDSISIPLPELRNRVNEISTDKPIVVHCAGGYRSAAASSMIKSMIGGEVPVYDLGERIKEFK